MSSVQHGHRFARLTPDKRLRMIGLDPKTGVGQARRPAPGN